MEGTASSIAQFFWIINNPLKFKFFLLKNLPVALLSGLQVESANEITASVSIPYKWLTRNPFGSTYFASMSMAAEMSTGILAMAHLYKQKPSIALLVVSVEGKFYKKAKNRTAFVCEEGNTFREAIRMASEGQPTTVKAVSKGYNANQELVAEFWITWSFKRREFE